MGGQQCKDSQEHAGPRPSSQVTKRDNPSGFSGLRRLYDAFSCSRQPVSS